MIVWGKFSFEVYLRQIKLKKQTVNKLPSGYIFNTDPSDKSGTHRVSVYIDENRSAECFVLTDSHREPITLKLGSSKIQLRGSTIRKCFRPIHYCLFYLLHPFRKIPLRSLQDIFTEDYVLNDTLVNNFISGRFDIDTPIVDLNMLKRQIARALQKL